MRHEFTDNVPRIHAGEHTDAMTGMVHWDPVKSLWIGSMSLITLVAAPMTANWQAFAIFLSTTALTLCAGHSVGMHRRLIHHSFDCPRWLEYLLVYLGTLVGMAGPYGMMRTHDLRDWAQRQAACHDYFAHRQSFWKDAWWQLHCSITLAAPPQWIPESAVAESRFYQFVEKTWMLQQLPPALILLYAGGWSWVVWGVCARVTISVTGHWFVGHFAHRGDHRSFHVEGAGVQGNNVRFAGLITMGESWHNNHHAFPESARLGLFPGQVDAGWWLILALNKFWLVWNIKTPDNLPVRPHVFPLNSNVRVVP